MIKKREMGERKMMKSIQINRRKREIEKRNERKIKMDKE